MTSISPAASELLGLASSGRARPAIDHVLGLLAAGVAVDEIVTEVLGGAQREVGRRWETGAWDVADEHAATAVLDGALGALSLSAPAIDAHRGSALVACAEGEHHTLPARMGAELLRSQGWEVTFLGGSLPATDLQRYAAVTEPDVVVVSCTVSLYLPGARRSFAAVDEVGLPAVAAGAAFGDDGVRARRLGASGVIHRAADLAAVLDERGTPPRATPAPLEAFAMELAAQDLQRSCLSVMVDRMPHMASDSPAQRAGARSDVGDILGYLTAAIDVGDDEVFSSFAAWLARRRQVRGVPPSVLDQTLDVIGGVMASAGMTEAARLCAGAGQQRLHN